MLDRLENQEALMEKFHRQISEFRSILFERSSFLAEKIEDSYNLTSSYFYQLVSGSDTPLTLYMDQRKAGSEQRQDCAHIRLGVPSVYAHTSLALLSHGSRRQLGDVAIASGTGLARPIQWIKDGIRSSRV